MKNMKYKNTKNSFLSSIVIALVVTALISSMVEPKKIDAATTANSDGSFQIDAAPVPSGVDFVDSTYITTSSLDPDDTTIFGVNFTISHSATLENLQNVTVYVYDDSVHGTDYNSVSANGLQLISLTWIESTGIWTLDQGSFTEWTEQTSIDPGIASALTSFTFTARFDISRTARYDTDWNATVEVYDDTDDFAADSEVSFVTMNTFFDVAFSGGTFSWGVLIQEGSSNNTHGALSLTVYANAAWELLLEQTDWTASAESPVDAELEDIAAWDDDGSNGGVSSWVRNTPTIMLGTWDNQSPKAVETSTELDRNVYIFLNPQTLFAGGKTWTATFTVTIQADT